MNKEIITNELLISVIAHLTSKKFNDMDHHAFDILIQVTPEQFNHALDCIVAQNTCLH